MLLSLLIAACLASPRSMQGAGPATAPDQPLPEFEAFARRAEAAIRSRDASFMDGAVDGEALLARALAGLELSGDARRDFSNGFLPTLKLGTLIEKRLGERGCSRLLRVEQHAGATHALFRHVFADMLDYYEYELARSPSGAVRIVDVTMFSAGERLSESVYLGALAMLRNEDDGLLDTLEGRDIDHYVILSEEIRRERWSEAMAEFAQLPADIAQLKSTRILKVCVASQLGEAHWLAAVDEVRRHHPSDPALDLLGIEAGWVRGDLESVLACIERLDRRVAGDPYLNLLRGDVHFEQGSLERAKSLYRQASREEPGLEDACWRLVSVALAQEQHAEVAGLLSRLESEFDAEIADLSGMEGYESFAQSPEYRAWLQRRE